MTVEEIEPRCGPGLEGPALSLGPWEIFATYRENFSVFGEGSLPSPK